LQRFLNKVCAQPPRPQVRRQLRGVLSALQDRFEKQAESRQQEQQKQLWGLFDLLPFPALPLPVLPFPALILA
jgi:hypothetical protein